jgi:hypothetical protein
MEWVTEFRNAVRVLGIAVMMLKAGGAKIKRDDLA